MHEHRKGFLSLPASHFVDKKLKITYFMKKKVVLLF